MIALLFFLELGYVPMQVTEEYDYLADILDVRSAYYAELGVEAEWRGVFVSGAVDVGVFKDKEPSEMDFWPFYLKSDFGLGYRRKGFEIGYRHMCNHPIVPYFFAWPPVVFRDSASDEFYLRLEISTKNSLTY